jgi:alkaline phosphatase
MVRLFELEQKPFFAMIEGGKIDWAGHDNDAGAMLHEILEFDSAYQVAYQFYLRHPDETLIIVTADHETGGLSIGTDAKGYAHLPQLLSYQKLPLYKFQEQIDSLIDMKSSLSGMYKCMEDNFGFNTDSELMLNAQDSSSFETKTFSAKQWRLHCNKLFCNKLGIGWTTTSHTGVAVPVRAIGIGAEQFRGFYTNSDIPIKILQLLNYQGKLN